MYNLTILERMIIESVNKSPKSLEALSEDTGLDRSICMNVAYTLLAKNLLVSADGAYSINKNLSESIIAELKDQRNRVVELNSLVRECIKDTVMEGNDSFRFKKVYMDEREKKLFKAMLYNLESFLDGLEKSKGSTKEETFVFWGGESYGKAVRSYIS